MDFDLLDLLDGDADDYAVVEEALALIDALEAAGSPSSPSSNSSTGSVTTSGSSLKKRRRSAAVDAARRQRKKQERAELQKEVQELEERLGLLRYGVSTTLVSCLSNSGSVLKSDEWHKHAIEQVHKAADAMSLNWRLRDALNRQSEMLDAVRAALAQPQYSQVSPERCHWSSEDYSIMLSLKRSIQQLYEGLDDALESVSFASGLFSSNLAFKLDPVLGTYSEHTSAALDPHGLDTVVKLIEDLQVAPPCVALRFHVKTLAPGTYQGTEKQYAMELPTPYKNIPLRGFGAIRLHLDPDRAAIVWSKQVVHASGLRFNERSWLVATSSSSNPGTQTVVRTFYQLTVEKTGNIGGNGPEDGLCNCIRSKLATRTREMIQFKLLEK